MEMFETVINLKPEAQWPAGTTMDKLIADMNGALMFPGVSNAWTMPIKARIDMLSTGIRTPVGVKLYGNNLAELDRLSAEIERVLRSGARNNQRLRRTRSGRLLPQHRTQPDGAGSLRAQRGRCAEYRPDRAWRRDGDGDYRRP